MVLLRNTLSGSFKSHTYHRTHISRMRIDGMHSSISDTTALLHFFAFHDSIFQVSSSRLALKVDSEDEEVEENLL